MKSTHTGTPRGRAAALVPALLTLVPALAPLALLALPNPALASGFQLKEQSADGLGNAFAGSTAKAQDLSTIFFNPAGMTRLSGHRVATVASVVIPGAEFSGSATTAFGTPVAGGQGGDAGGPALLPSFYALYDLSPDVKLGLAVNTPWGLKTHYDEDWVGRYQAVKSDLKTINIAPSVAWRVAPTLSVGAGVQIQYAEAELTQAVFTGTPADGNLAITGDDWAVGANLGVLWEATPDTRVGLNWRTRVDHELSGETTLGLPVVGGVTRSGKADLTTPDVVSLGVYHDLTPQWAVMADVAWTRWSLFDELRVRQSGGPDLVTPENWENTMFYSAGVTYRPTSQWSLQGGLAYDATPIPDSASRTPRIPDADRVWLSGGIGYQWSDALKVNLAYTHIFVDSPSITHSSATTGSITGTYDNRVDIVAASLSLTF